MKIPSTSVAEAWLPQLWTGRQNIQAYSTQDTPTDNHPTRPLNESFNLEDLPMTVLTSNDSRAGDPSSCLDFYPDLAKGPGRQSWAALLPGVHGVGFGQGLLSDGGLFEEGMLLGSKTREELYAPKHRSLGSKSSHEALQASLANSIVEGSGSDKDLEQSSVPVMNPGLTQQLVADPVDEIDRQREKNR